jgi:hypothetical protein
MEAAGSPETPVFTYSSIWCHNLGDHNLKNHHCEKLRIYIFIL